MKKINKNPFTFDLVPLYDIADEIINIYKNEIINIDAIAPGDLLNSIDFDIVQKDDNTLTLQLIVLDYYYFIEWGRDKTGRLDTPWENPVEDISRWINKKIQRGKWIPKNNKPIPTTQKEIRKASYAIIKKIHEHGYYTNGDGGTRYGKHPLQNTLKKSIADGLIEKFTNALADQMQNDIVVDITGLSDKLKKRPK